MLIYFGKVGGTLKVHTIRSITDEQELTFSTIQCTNNQIHNAQMKTRFIWI